MGSCQLCDAEPLTDRLHEDDECWVADCLVCMTPMVVWRTHGLPEAQLEAELLRILGDVAAARYGGEGFYAERRRIPDHWHAHARPAGGFFDPRSDLYGRWR